MEIEFVRTNLAIFERRRATRCSAGEEVSTAKSFSTPAGSGTVGLIRSLLSQDATGLPSGVFTFFSRAGWEESEDATGLPSGVSRFESGQGQETIVKLHSKKGGFFNVWEMG